MFKKTVMKLNNIEKSIISASNWLFKSGIQNVSDDQNIDGSFNAWFKQDSRKYPYNTPMANR